MFSKNLLSFFMVNDHGKPPCQKPRLWPTGFTDTEDRILNQLSFALPVLTTQNDGNTPPRPLKIIYDTQPLAKSDKGQQRFLRDQCPVSNCFLTDESSAQPTATAVILHRAYLPTWKRPPNQIWILFMLESPMNTQGLSALNNRINMTATYRTDSTIVTPYERFVPHANASQYQLKTPKKNFAAGKKKSVAWFVSNCATRNNRMQYAHELAKYIGVDIYGSCGNLRCSRGNSACYQKLSRDYKFYLAFENSNCKDYITEKFYWNGLL